MNRTSCRKALPKSTVTAPKEPLIFGVFVIGLLTGCSSSPAPVDVRVAEASDNAYIVELQSKEDGLEVTELEVNRGQCQPRYARNRGQRPPPYTLNYLESRQTDWVCRGNPVREVKIVTNKGTSVVSY